MGISYLVLVLQVNICFKEGIFLKKKLNKTLKFLIESVIGYIRIHIRNPLK